MAIYTQVLKDRNLIYIKGSGTITFDDLRENFNSILKNPSLQPNMNTIWNIPEANAIISSDELKQIVEYMVQNKGSRGEDYKIALVTKSPYMYGMGRMLQAYDDIGPFKTKVFPKIEEAIEWVYGDSNDLSFI